MDAISGGTSSAGGAAASLVPDAPSTSSDRVAEALLRCMGRWGLAKTTVEDVAREAGVSRATVYRLFPGGKLAILEHAADRDVRRLVAALTVELAAIDDLEQCIVRGVVLAAEFLDRHDALGFMRSHEPVVLEQVLGFDRLDTLFLTAGQLMAPVLTRFMPADEAQDLAVWLTRMLASYFYTPSQTVDLSEPGSAGGFVAAFVMPGIAARRLARPAAEQPTVIPSLSTPSAIDLSDN